VHIPDGFLSLPVWASCGAISAAAVALAVRKTGAGREHGGAAEDSRLPLTGVTAAFVFAAQMVNFPVAGGTSGHLTGAVLASLLLGPWAAVLVMSAILIVQALLFQDGGITALGANILNMGLVGAFGGYWIYRLTRRLFPGRRASLAACFFASWLAVVASSGLASVEIALSGTAPLRIVLPAMAGVHALIGTGEGLITAAALAFLLKVRADLVHPSCRPLAAPAGTAAGGGAA
jgi:cobalt/nickel transport system permease protein